MAIVRYAAKPAFKSKMPKDCNTWADLSTVDKTLSGWGVRVPIKRKVAYRDVVEVVRASGVVVTAQLGQLVHTNSQFAYWTQLGTRSDDFENEEERARIGVDDDYDYRMGEDASFEEEFGYTPGDQ